MDSRLRGNDGMFFPGIGVVGQWIPAFAGMTGLVSLWGYVTSGLSSTCHRLNILQKTQHRNGRSTKNQHKDQRTDKISEPASMSASE